MGYAASESLFIPSDIRVRRAVGLHELYKSVMILGFPLLKRNIAQPGPAKYRSTRTGKPQSFWVRGSGGVLKDPTCDGVDRKMAIAG